MSEEEMKTEEQREKAEQQREAMKEYLKRWHAQHPEKCKLYNEHVKAKNPNYWTEYRKAHKADVKRNQQKWLDKKANYKHTLTPPPTLENPLEELPS
jgi:hypothetical protein